MKKSKPAVVLLIIFFVISAFYFGYKRTSSINSNQVIKTATTSVSLKIEGNEEIKINTSKINGLELLKEQATVVTKGEGESAYVTTINGKEAQAENKEFWAFYVNDKQADVGAGSYQLTNGDKIEWKIEKY